jgi:hypothetical protein
MLLHSKNGDHSCIPPRPRAPCAGASTPSRGGAPHGSWPQAPACWPQQALGPGLRSRGDCASSTLTGPAPRGSRCRRDLRQAIDGCAGSGRVSATRADAGCEHARAPPAPEAGSAARPSKDRSARVMGAGARRAGVTVSGVVGAPAVSVASAREAHARAAWIGLSVHVLREPNRCAGLLAMSVRRVTNLVSNAADGVNEGRAVWVVLELKPHVPNVNNQSIWRSRHRWPRHIASPLRTTH